MMAGSLLARGAAVGFGSRGLIPLHRIAGYTRLGQSAAASSLREFSVRRAFHSSGRAGTESSADAVVPSPAAIALAAAAADLVEQENKEIAANPAPVRIKKPKKPTDATLVPPEGVKEADKDKEKPPSALSAAWQTFKRVAGLVGKEAAYIVVAAGLAIAAAALGLQVPSALSDLWQRYSSASTADSAGILWPFLRAGALVAGQFVLRYASGWLMSMGVEQAAARLREQLFAACLEEDVAFFDSIHSAQLVSLLTVDVKELRDTMRSLLTEGLSQVAFAVGGVGSLFSSSAKLSAALSATVPIGAIIAHLYAARLRRLSRRSQEAQARTAAVASESLANIRTVKAFSAEALERSRYHAAMSEASEASARISSEISLFHSLLGFAMAGLAGATFLYGGYLVSSGEMEKAQLLAYIAQTQGMARALEGLSIQHTRLLQAKGSFDRVTAVLDAAEERRHRHSQQHNARWDDFRGHLRLEGVTFAYPSRPDAVILKDVAIDIPAGKVTSLAGPSGSGKSTLAALLLGFYQLPERQEQHTTGHNSEEKGNGTVPSSPATLRTTDNTARAFASAPPPARCSRGLVTVDGRPLQMVDIQWLRDRIAYVPQDCTVFNMSVRDNITYGSKDNSAVTEEEIIEAAKAAQAWDFISKLPQGLDTVVGERGGSLSGGQKQRIALSRALLRKPRILILDEYSAALDAETEAGVQEALSKRFEGDANAPTVIIVAHRLSTIAHSHQIVVMSDGAVVESGSHAELSSKPNGLYAGLVKRQTQLAGAGAGAQALVADSTGAPSTKRNKRGNTDSELAAVMRERLASSSATTSGAA